MKSLRSGRWLFIAEWALLASLICYMGGHAYSRAWRTLETDFPNYYLTARLAREHYDTSRIYEWQWLQRQKDHRGIDQRLVGMVPITPFSTLLVWPIASMSPLQAKHIWLLFSCFSLLALITVLQSITQLPWRRVALITAISVPLQANFILGQYYVFLLLLMSVSCWLYLRQRLFLAGLFMGFAAALKIFPAMYLIYFLRKKDWKAFFGGVTGCVASTVLSLFVFGWNLHRTYLTQVLPSVLRGEALEPYNLVASSLSSLLHSLFIFEPQLNPHPALNVPWLFALLHPLLQMLVLAPALLLARPNEALPTRLQLEWSAILLVSLAVSTSPASYLFTLLILPVCLMCNCLYIQHSYKSLALLLFLYMGIGSAHAPRSLHSGWYALLGVPRLYFLILLCIFSFILLLDRSDKFLSYQNRSWQLGLTVILVLSIMSNVRHQRGLYCNYQWRLPAPAHIYMASHATVQPDSLAYISMSRDGYHLTEKSRGTVQFSPANNDDFLTLATSSKELWLEEAGLQSNIVSTRQNGPPINQAESPAISPDGCHLAFLRDDGGRSRIWLHFLTRANLVDVPLTSRNFNVLEIGFLANDTIVFSAIQDGQSELYTVDLTGKVERLGIEHARYPAGSPDGTWLTYSQLSSGTWNLWLRDRHSGESRRLTDASCNDIEPAWTLDSKSIVYGSDCGRGLWFTALCKRRVVP